MIVVDSEKLLFTLHTKNTTYQMKADARRVLLHTYYGARIGDCDLSQWIRTADRGFSPNPNDAFYERVYSLDTLPQEYSTCGVGDFRLPALEVEQADGSHMVDLRCEGYHVRRGKYALAGLPAFFGGDEWETLSVRLHDAATQLEVELLYGVLEERDLITRAVRITNRSAKTVRLLRVASACLDLPQGDLDWITFDGAHVQERRPSRTPLRPGVQSVGSVRGMSSHQHNPFVMLCESDANEESGLCYGAMLLYSGNFEAAAQRAQFETARLTLGVHPFHFCWTLAPKESFTAPEAALVCSPAGFGPMSRQFHRAMRECLIRDPYKGARRPVLINNWEATEFDFTAEKLLGIAAAAAPLGVELFVMDDGWFGSRNSDYGGLGDWSANEKKLPGGLAALAPRIRALGLSFGLWVEPEMVSEDSALYRAHPDWALGAPGRPQTRGRSQLVLDFSRAEVRAYLYEQLARILDSAEISYLKWDMNRSLTDVWSAALPAGRQGEVYHRYVLGVYEVLERLRGAYPKLLIEGCCGGGGRFDAGMLYYTPQIWCSDNTDAIDRVRIQYGTSFGYPVSAMGAHVSAVPNAQTGRVTPMRTRGVAAMSGTFGYEMDPRTCTEREREIIREQTAFFKEHYALLTQGDYYRLTDPFGDAGLAAWQQVSANRREALVSVVTGSNHAAAPFRSLRLKGLDPALCYQVNGEGRYPGSVLMHAGWPLPLPQGDYRSLQMYLCAVE